jgi:hypothetical protein
MIKVRRLMTVIELFPYLNVWDLARFSQLNRACNELLNPRSNQCVNFKVLFKAWGINLTLAEVKETLISTSKALQLRVK